MTEPSDAPSPQLRKAILADLIPVARLKAPSRRVLVVLPLALLLIAGLHVWLGPRRDAPVIGTALLWGPSIVQWLLGFVLLVAALNEAVPGRAIVRSRALFGLGALTCLAVTHVTWWASATRVPRGWHGYYWVICFVGPVLLGLPLLAVVLWLASRAYPLRPTILGAFAGLGVGLVVDAGWRTFCHVSDPTHVLGSHILAVVGLCALGAAFSTLFSRRRP